MSAFFKTLFGDLGTIAVVAVVVAAEALLVGGGQATLAALAVPPLTLAGVAWLVKR